jgi:DNA polymerase III delta prime subunit
MTKSIPNSWHGKSFLQPESLSEMALPKKVRRDLEIFIGGDFWGLLLVGDIGTGKTTIANIISRKFKKEIGSVYDKYGGMDFGGTSGQKRFLKEIINNSQTTMVIGRDRQKLFVIDEAQYLSMKTLQPHLKTAMQNSQDNTSWIFTSNSQEAISEGVQERCDIINFPELVEHKKTGKLLIEDTFGMTEKEWHHELIKSGNVVAAKLGITIPNSIYESVLSKAGNLVSGRSFIRGLSKEYKIWESTQK